jgi:glucose-6-phosphate 1-dehydrogenase
VSVAPARAPAEAGTFTVPNDHVIVLFGVTGDLARRKLLSGLFHLTMAGLMPESFRVIGTSRSELDDDGFRRRAKEAVNEFGREPASGEAWA